MSTEENDLYYKYNKSSFIILKILGIIPIISEKNINPNILFKVMHIYPLCLFAFFIFHGYLECYWFKYNTTIGKSVVYVCYTLYVSCETIIPILTIFCGKYLNIFNIFLKQSDLEKKLVLIGIPFPRDWWSNIVKKLYLSVLLMYLLFFLNEYYICFGLKPEFVVPLMKQSVILSILNSITEIYNVTLQTLFILSVLKLKKKFALVSLALSQLCELRTLKLNYNKPLKIQVQPHGMTVKQQILIIKECHSTLCLSAKVVNDVGGFINLLKITQTTLISLLAFYIYLLGVIAIFQGDAVNWLLTYYISVVALRNVLGFFTVTLACTNCSKEVSILTKVMV